MEPSVVSDEEFEDYFHEIGPRYDPCEGTVVERVLAAAERAMPALAGTRDAWKLTRVVHAVALCAFSLKHSGDAGLDRCAAVLDTALDLGLRDGVGVASALGHNLMWLTRQPDGFPEPLLAVVERLFARAEFRASRGAESFLFHLTSEWPELPPAQRARLLAAVEAAYPHFARPMAWFSASEILGSFVEDDRGLLACRRLRAVCPEGPRGLLAHALQHVATDTRDPALAARAVSERLLMRDDPSRNVQRLAREHLGIVAHRRVALDTLAAAGLSPDSRKAPKPPKKVSRDRGARRRGA